MAFVPSEFMYSGWEGMYFHRDATPWATWCFAGGLASLKGRPGVGQERALLGEGGGSPDCGWVSRFLPFFQQNVWFPYRLWGGILTTEALSRFRRDLFLAGCAAALFVCGCVCSWLLWLPFRRRDLHLRLAADDSPARLQRRDGREALPDPQTLQGECASAHLQGCVEVLTIF